MECDQPVDRKTGGEASGDMVDIPRVAQPVDCAGSWDIRCEIGTDLLSSQHRMGELFPLFEPGFSGISVNGVKAPMSHGANGCPM